MEHPYIGEIALFAFDWAPEGWVKCDGRKLSIDNYDTLFFLIETQYGGDGVKTFAVPDLRFAAVQSPSGKTLNYFIATEGIFP